MQSDFEAACKDARDRIRVPEIPLAAICSAAERRAKALAPKRWARSVVAAIAGSALLAAAAGAAVWSSTHISFDGTGLFDVVAQKASTQKKPSVADLRAFARRADFPVVIPSGLPAGTTLEGATMFDSSAILLTYDLPGVWRRSDHLLSIMLTNPHSLAKSSQSRSHQAYRLLVGHKGPAAAQWRVGDEAVLVLSSTMTTAELARVKRATLAEVRQR